MSDTAHWAVGFPIAVRLLAAGLLWILTPGSLQAAASGDEVTMEARPRICVTPAGEQACSVQLLVTWTSTTSRNVCLHLHGRSESLQCWEAQQAGTFSTALAQPENILIQLLDAENLEVLSEIAIPVIKRDLRDTRRRRRHAWSIF